MWRPEKDLVPSGVQWIGSIPRHWEVARTPFVARLESGHTPSRAKPEYWENCDIPWFTLSDVWQIRDEQAEYVHETKEKISALGLKNSAARLLPAGTVILSRTASVGFSGILAEPMATTQDFVNWICGPKLLPDYLLYVFRAMKSEFRRLTMGSTHQTIYMPDVRKFVTPLPPVEEQKAIVALVRSRTLVVDSLIEQKERLIELLQEKRTALITRAVTRGLDPDVEMKDSGVEWSGHMPTHWTIKPLGRVVRLQRGIDITKEEQRDGEVPVVSSGGVSSYHDRAFAKGPGVVLGRKGSVGTVHWIECDYWPHDTTLWVTDFLGNDPRFVFYKLTTLPLTSFDTGSANPTLNRNELHPLVLGWPTPEEQRQIAKQLDEALSIHRVLITNIEQAIALLREYRTALISAAVTGKIDVREHAA